MKSGNKQAAYRSGAMAVLWMACLVFTGGCASSAFQVAAADRVEQKEQPSGMRMAVDLRDGSHLVGVSRQDVLPVHGSLGKIKIPLADIKKITMHEDREQATLALANGDRLTGVPNWRTVKLTTLVGDLAIPLAELREVTLLGRPGDVEKGLVLWNTLGSEVEIQHSRVGPGGTFRGGSFIVGPQGNAYMARHDQNGLVTFPREVVPVQAGCIEIWAKLEEIPNELQWGQNPGLFSVEGFIINLNGNDGSSKGGLCGVAGQLGSCGTGTYGSWTYARALDGLNPNDWHHYALVWDKEGIKGVGDGTHTVAVFLDGRLNSKAWAESKPNTVEPIPLTQGELALMVDQHLKQGWVGLDEIKIWSYAKTDFQESLRNRP